MAQEDVFNCIKKAKRPICIREMAEIMDISIGRIGDGCRKLCKTGFITKKTIITDLGGTMHPRKVNFYSVKK